ncbi:zinc-binding dehydrogenase [Silvibacterium sp.]|uniref:zinc-binding dehydrogenase n=1 Tax=Silvibacterium sp. TaxID=1964179 RepID=UPI0039E4D9F9
MGEARGWVWSGGREPEQLQLSPLQIPEPAPEEVIVENRAVALNPVDWKVLPSTTLGWQPGHVPGVDGAGVVIAAREKAGIAVGTRVAYHQNLEREGSFATHTKIVAKALHVVPEGVSFAQAATVPCPGLTAWQAIDKLPVEAGRDVLVIGGGAATGNFLTQLAVDSGYRVWVTASERHHPRLRAMGVAGLCDYHDAKWRMGLLDALQRTSGSGNLYAAIDTVGEDHARTLAPLIGYNGHLVSLQGRLNTPPMPGFTTVISLHEVALGAIYRYGSELDWQKLRAAGQGLLGAIAEGQMQTPEIEPFDFEDLGNTLARLKAGRQRGKLVAEL